MATILSQQELYNTFIAVLESLAPELTDEVEGSINDVLGGVSSSASRELELLITDEFRKTYFDSAQGPDENNGGADDLQTLAIDHFGDAFARPGATSAIGIVTFSRPNTDSGNVTILAGTVVKTAPNANGVSQRFATIATVIMSGLTINASVQALVPGIAGNVGADTVHNIETALTDSGLTVTNTLGFAGGAAELDSPTYRNFIRNLIEAIKGATIAAIEAKAKTVPGVVTANILEIEKVVIEWDIATATSIGSYFRIPYATLYIADANGTASAALIAAVVAAIRPVRACGVNIPVVAATAFVVNWTASITLNPSGPNYAELVVDPSMITDVMIDYINGLITGSGFVVTTANAAIMAIFGPTGTNDLVAFSTSVPSGNIAAVAGTKLTAGVVQIST